MSRSGILLLALAVGGCVDFQTALSECEQTGRCGDAITGGGGGTGGDAGSTDGGEDAGAQLDAGCVDLDLDGLGPGCAQPDCDETDGQRPLQLPCKAGAYVCRSCPGASDLNSGAPSSPLRTIAAGINFARSLQLDEVQVANPDRFTPATYTESFDMAPGVSVNGRYYVADGGWQHPAAVRTIILNTRPDGILFPAGIGRDSRLSGFHIRSIGGDAGTAITIRGSSPTIEDVAAGFPLAVADLSYGIRVEGVAGGATANPLLVDVYAFAVTGYVEAVGVSVSNAAVDMRGGYAYGGTIKAGGAGIGLRLSDSPGSTILNSVLIGCITMPAGLASGLCDGLRATGDVSGTVIGGAVAYGSYDESPTNGDTIALDFGLCGSWDGGEPATVGGSISLLGAVANANNGSARGLRVREGCAVNIVDNRIQGATTIGPSGNVAGITCSRGVGTEARCSIRRNIIQSHGAGATGAAYGVVCGCSTCDGGCVDVVDNEIDSLGGAGGTFHTLIVYNASPLVARNRINLKQTDATCAIGRGAVFNNSESRVENNFIRGGNCQNSVGVVVQQIATAGPGPVLHSNSITGGEAGAVEIGLYLTQSSAGLPPFGRYVSNIISTGNSPGAGTRCATIFQGDALPTEMTGNLLHTAGGTNIAYASWGGSNTPYTIAQFNALTYAEGNIDGVPGFVTWRNFHLTAGSVAIDAGTFEQGPADDIDRAPRPLPDAGFLPAIGADQP